MNDPLEQAENFIKNGLPKNSKRVAEIRKRFSSLMFSSHEYGAGGVKDSVRYQAYRTIVIMCHKNAENNSRKAAGK